MPNILPLIVSAGGWAGFAASIFFNVVQHRRYTREQAARAEEQTRQRRREEDAERARRDREQAPPQLYNHSGNPGPIVISGKEHSAQGPFMHLWGVVTVVNSNPSPMKLGFARLVLADKEYPVHRFFFCLYRERERFDRVSLIGNQKADYELHFMFSETQFPQGQDGVLWFESSNRQEPFTVEVTFR